MRPKFVFGILLAAFLAAGAALLLKQETRNSAAAPRPAASGPPANSNVVANDFPPPAPFPAEPPPAPRVLTPEERQAAIDAELERLQDWSRNEDSESLSNILLDLTNSEKEVREAAIEAAKQFGSTNAIPALKAAAINSTNTDEQIELLEAANFLSLPAIGSSPPTPEQIQAAQQRRAQMEAQRQARMQQQQQQQQQPQQGQGQNPNGPAGPGAQPAQPPQQ